MDKFGIMFDSNIFGHYKKNELIKKVKDYDNYSKINYNPAIDKLIRFLNRNKLLEFVTLFLPKMVLLEIMHQQKTSYERLTNMLESIIAPEIKIEISSIDYLNLIEQELPVLKSQLNLKIIEFPEKNILSNLVERSLTGNEPFNSPSSSSDKGFKDAVIWESILNYNFGVNFKKIFFLCLDSRFSKDCEDEFKKENDLELEVIKTEKSILKVISILQNKYHIDSELDEIKDFINFKLKKIIEDDLKAKELIQFEEDDREIDFFKIISITVNDIEKVEGTEGIFYLNKTKIEITTKDKDHIEVLGESKIYPMTSSTDNINYNYKLK